jgi:phage shock protein A
MATRKKIGREIEAMRGKADAWNAKASLAVDKGRDDLAREALAERRAYLARVETLEADLSLAEEHVGQYGEDIRQLEEKLASAREKQRMLVARHVRASVKKRAHEDMRRFDSSEVFLRFEQFEGRIDRMEAEADLVQAGRSDRAKGLEEQFAALSHDEDIERELDALKQSRAGK